MYIYLDTFMYETLGFVCCCQGNSFERQRVDKEQRDMYKRR